jgi:uncharacterized repeat protein (TIGR03803 family)
MVSDRFLPTTLPTETPPAKPALVPAISGRSSVFRFQKLLLAVLCLCGLLSASACSQEAQVQTVHQFTGSPDGDNPTGGLMQASDGNYYGTTRTGGANGFGSVFQMDGQSYAITVIYSFTNLNSDGEFPSGGLVEGPTHLLYGVTNSGGNNGLGTVYTVDFFGTEAVIHSMGDLLEEGTHPIGSLVLGKNATLYGVCFDGGGREGSGFGTLYAVDTIQNNGNNIETLWTFTGSPDGANPNGTVYLDDTGVIYGTTAAGGASNNGTIFRSDAEVDVVHSFNGSSDGSVPNGPLVADSLGNLYGTTNAAGAGGGTIFKVSKSGIFNAIYTFSGNDGTNPTAGLIFGPGGNLYGLNSAGPFLISLLNGSYLQFVLGDFRSVVSPLFWGYDGNMYGGSDQDLNGVFRLLVAPTVINATPSTASVAGGNSALVNFKITLPAGPGGTTVAVSSDNPAAVVPGSVVVDENASSGSVVINTIPVAKDTVASITLSLNGTLTAEALTVRTATVIGAVFRPATVVGGTIITATVTLSSPAASSGESVNFTCASGLVIVPVSLQIPGGQTTASFNFLTKGVTTSTPTTVQFSRWGTSQTASVTLLPASITLLSPLASTIVGGQQDTVSIAVDGLTASAITLESSDASLTCPPSVTLPAGQIHTTFRVTSTLVTSDKAVTITATYGGSTKVCTINILAAKLSLLTIGPSPVIGGRPMQGLVAIAGAAPTGGAIVNVTSSSAAVTVPSTVTIAAGAGYKYFPASANPVNVPTNVTITASLNGISKTGSVTVNPPILNAMSLSKISFKGGTGTSGTVYLNAPAGSQGVLVHLFLSNTSVASVAATVMIPAGQMSVPFGIESSATTKSAVVTVTASSASGGLVSRTFTVTP